MLKGGTTFAAGQVGLAFSFDGTDAYAEAPANDGWVLGDAEGSFEFWVNFRDYLDTGLFLDHRIIRQMLRDWARDADFLNLFCYTGSATVYAARGGAVATSDSRQCSA